MPEKKMKKTNDNQIIKIDGRDCFVEVTADAFEIGKVRMNFVKYDLTLQPGSRQTDFIPIYMDFSMFLLFAQDVLSGRLASLPDSKLFELMGGTSAERLAHVGKSRDDKMSLSRQFRLMKGSKRPFLLQAEQGPGETSDTGLIMPRYGKKFGVEPEQKIMIPMTAEDLKRLCLLTRTHIEAYISSRYQAPQAQEAQQATQAS